MSGSGGPVFGRSYSSSYDLIYRDKDYDAECAMIENCFREFASGQVQRVLDLGCGTGNHSIRLAKHGFEVTGVDRSSEMLAAASRKAEECGVAVQLHRADLRDACVPGPFDAALMMFAVLGYQTENEDVIRSLQTARRHLRTGGVLIFDVWYGPAVLAQRPGERVRAIRENGRTILRTSSSTLDTLHHQCLVHFRLWDLNGSSDPPEITEDHRMRFFFPEELRLFLQTTGFRLCRLGDFLAPENDPTEATWNIVAIAQAV